MLKEITKGIFIICKIFLIIELIAIIGIFYINHNCPGILNIKECFISLTPPTVIILIILYLNQKLKNYGENKN